jgi:hypothetical protein
MGLALTALFTSPSPAATPETPNADQILRQACAQLAAAQQFSFKAHREMDPALVPGSEVAQIADIEVTVERPNKAVAESKSKKGLRRLYFDGQNFSLLDAKMNLYATIPMHTSIDGVVDQMDTRFGFVPPLAEFTVSDPHKEFHRDASGVSYLGRTTLPCGLLNLGNVQCEHLALTGPEADSEVWIGVNDHLLKKLVATFHRKGNPQLHITFSSWNLAATVNASDFTFTAPQGAQKIKMRPIAEN